MRFVIDMNLSPSWVAYLAGEGHDAVHWSDVGPANAPDSDVLRWAAQNDRVLLTNDLDFGAMLAASGDNIPSVIQLRSDLLRPADLGPALAETIDRTRAELAAGALVTLDAPRSRVRLLPLTR